MHRFLVAWIGVGMGLMVCHVSRAADPAESEPVYEGKPLSHWIGQGPLPELCGGAGRHPGVSRGPGAGHRRARGG